jgi:hypothetical protein
MRALFISRILSGGIIFCAAFGVLAGMPSRSEAEMSTSVNIVNNSGRVISHVYLSHVGSDDWTGDQLSDSVIASGQSRTLNSVACDQQQVRVIAEDGDGCFLSTVVSCGDNATWTITSETTRDCGGS